MFILKIDETQIEGFYIFSPAEVVVAAAVTTTENKKKAVHTTSFSSLI